MNAVMRHAVTLDIYILSISRIAYAHDCVDKYQRVSQWRHVIPWAMAAASLSANENGCLMFILESVM